MKGYAQLEREAGELLIELSRLRREHAKLLRKVSELEELVDLMKEVLK